MKMAYGGPIQGGGARREMENGLKGSPIMTIRVFSIELHRGTIRDIEVPWQV